MKIKTFLIAFLGALVIMLAAATIVYLQLVAVQSIAPHDLTDKLYRENTRILALAMRTVTPDSVEGLSLPGSWAELMVVDNGSLVISASSTAKNKGQYLYNLPNLLDQGKGIIAAMQNKQEVVISTADYMVAIRPLDGDRSLIGFKPKAWERGLITTQNTRTQLDIRNIRTMLMIFLGGGTLAALVIAFLVAMVTGRSTVAMMKSLEELSLGNLEVSPPAGKNSFTASFLRIKASLSMALNRLGD